MKTRTGVVKLLLSLVVAVAAASATTVTDLPDFRDWGPVDLVPRFYYTAVDPWAPVAPAGSQWAPVNFDQPRCPPSAWVQPGQTSAGVPEPAEGWVVAAVLAFAAVGLARRRVDPRGDLDVANLGASPDPLHREP